MARSQRARQIRQLLEDRKQQLSDDVQGLARDVERAVVQMKTETVARIDSAIRRLDQGRQGDCIECGEPIPAERLAAMPLALRCGDCEASRVRALNGRGARLASVWHEMVVSGLD